MPGAVCATCKDKGEVLSPLDGYGPPITDPCPTCHGPGTTPKEPTAHIGCENPYRCAARCCECQCHEATSEEPTP